ncbi:hypothetical protein [Paracoccus laeviglucosivorans]|uniref:hypothetical protein n=1 Tax=Paracoccus laeviglucosivorans TaxID=1197861 RepID=UPI0011598A2A|nr:hypothetical protein [Paracoccus laeviglucosivorans]
MQHEFGAYHGFRLNHGRGEWRDGSLGGRHISTGYVARRSARIACENMILRPANKMTIGSVASVGLQCGGGDQANRRKPTEKYKRLLAIIPVTRLNNGTLAGRNAPVDMYSAYCGSGWESGGG